MAGGLLPAGTQSDPTYVYVVGGGAFGAGAQAGAGSFGIGMPSGSGFGGNGAGGGGFGSLLSAGLSIYSATKGGQAGGVVSTPGIAPSAGGGAGGGTDWLGTAASVAPMMGPQGAAIGAGLSILDMFTHKKTAAPSGTSARAGGPTPVFITGMAPGLMGGAAGSGGAGGKGSALLGLAGMAASFIPGGGLAGKILGGLGHVFHFANGGVVPGQGNHDSVPAMLMPHEVVLSHAMLAGTAPPPSLPPSFITNVQHAAPSALSKADLTDAFRAALAGSDSSRGVSIGNVTQTNHYSAPSSNGSEDLATTLRQRLG